MPENRVSKSRYDDEPLFVTWDDPKNDKGASMKIAMTSASRALSSPSTSINRSDGYKRAIATNIFENIAPGNTSIRDSFSRRDYEMFRPGEQLPKRIKDIIVACNEAYRHVGIVHNVIDLMGDFTVQGIDIVHPNPKIEKFFKQWWRRIEGGRISERFANYLYRMANVVVKRTMAKIPQQYHDQLEKIVAAGQPAGSTIFNENMRIDAPAKIERGKIPWKYHFLNPLTVEVMAEEIAPFVGEDGYMYSLRLGEGLASKVKNPTKAIMGQLRLIPSQIRNAIQNGSKLIELPSNQIYVAYYKKDDWQVWAEPFTFSILEDLRMLEKMKLADLAALDGAISHIRLWRLGSLDHKLMPTNAAVERLATMLLTNVGGGSMDLIWGPDLDLKETSTDVQAFLGEAKYAPVLNNIYAGLGIPPTLTGSASASGFTNNFISLRTLTERLNYGRSILIAFWENEIRIVQKAMGFRFPAQLVFDRPVLTDEATELALLIQLADRGLISDESIQDRFGMLPEIERIRTTREQRQRDGGKRNPKAGPWNNPQQDHEMNKIALTQGTMSPKQAGVETKDGSEPADKSLLDIQGEQQQKQSKLQMQQSKNENDHTFRMERLQLKHGVHPLQQQPGQPQQGRPRTSKDAQKRKQKTVKPRSKASAEFVANLAWAREAQKSIAEIIHPVYLDSVGKENMRQLTTDEVDNVEILKFAVLCNTPIYSEISQEQVFALLQKDEPLAVPQHVHQLEQATMAKFVEKHQAEPSMEDMRQIQASVYSLANTNLEQEENNGED